MDLQRLKQIEEIYHVAAEMPAGDRHDFYAEACVDDENLRVEVESLLSFEKITDSFIDTAPDDIAAEMFSDQDESPRLIGQTIGHYKIKSLLGVGGMGEVYLADDDLLNRKVALKLVWPGLVMHGDQLKRFKREAQASSALNHPNILTIHEFGTENGANYIVSEFVDGITLRKRINDGSLSFKEILEIAVQVASALGEAHGAGIVHRDIKPDNIMIRRDGIVKLLDFGIAKLTMPVSQDHDLSKEAQTLFKTAPGIVMGTAEYMSPEQARGINLDSRTDIWSLGVVLYEMFSGKVPFSGITHADVLVAILGRPLVVLDDLPSDLPAPLVRLIEKALAKDVNERYQSVEELCSVLKNIRNRLEFEAELGRSQSDGSDGDNKLNRLAGSAPKILPTTSREAATQQLSIHATNSDAHSEGKNRTILAAMLALVVFSGVLGVFVWNSDMSDKAVPLTSPPMVSQYKYVHFATHGVMDAQRPGLSSLVLSTVDADGKPQNGFLRANDIYNMKLPAEWVVFSACQTGLGKEVKGEGLIGLTRGFMYAGAKRVVVSLWSVNDKATSDLMTKFYRGMLKNNERPAAALRAAQVEMWKQKQWQSPYYWAAFTMQGEWK